MTKEELKAKPFSAILGPSAYILLVPPALNPGNPYPVLYSVLASFILGGIMQCADTPYADFFIECAFLMLPMAFVIMLVPTGGIPYLVLLGILLMSCSEKEEVT